jgi:hypothetical protein
MDDQLQNKVKLLLKKIEFLFDFIYLSSYLLRLIKMMKNQAMNQMMMKKKKKNLLN